VSARADLRNAQRLVVKLGTQVVTYDGVELALGRLMGLVESLARLRQAGREILLVSSGAVAMGMRTLRLSEPPRSLGLRQACAAVGQGQLLYLYTQAFAQLGVTTAQVLLTQEDLADRDRALCLRTTLLRLLELGTLPILNENDSVSVRELVEHRRSAGDPPSDAEPAFGDNDGLSARVAVALDADLLVLLTNVAGVYTGNPALDPQARLLEEIDGVDDALLETAQGGSRGGTGGMLSKLEAARLMVAEGAPVLIASGDEPRVVERALEGEIVGTLIVPREVRPARLRRIATGSAARGALTVNDGAARALTQGKASLLPIGVTAVSGEFEKGDVVEIRDGSGRVLARGLANYDADAARALLGRHSDDIEKVLGWRGYDALVTRDNLVMGLV
jgi:glutamate 5-kinase